MWVDCRECVPFPDGEYMIQTIYGDVKSMGYTYRGGWNTYYDNEGRLICDNAINTGYIARWFNLPRPKPIPPEWEQAYSKRRGR